MPGGFGFLEVAEGAGEFHAHLLQPFNGVGTLVEVSLHQILVRPVVGVFHVHLNGLVHAQVVEGGLLDLGVDAQRAHAHVGSAAGGAGFLQDHSLHTLLARGDGSGQTGGAAGHDDDIGFDGFHDIHLNMFGLVDGSRRGFHRSGLGLGGAGKHPLAFHGGQRSGLAFHLCGGSCALHGNRGGGQLGQAAAGALDGLLFADGQAFAAPAAVEAVDHGHQSLAALDALLGTGGQALAAAIAQLRVHIELGQRQAGIGGTFLAAHVSLGFGGKGIHCAEGRQCSLLAQCAVAGYGHRPADLLRQVQITGLCATQRNALENFIQLIQALPAEGALAAALAAQGEHLLFGQVHRAVPVGHGAQHAAAAGKAGQRHALQLLGGIEPVIGEQALAGGNNLSQQGISR